MKKIEEIMKRHNISEDYILRCIYAETQFEQLDVTLGFNSFELETDILKAIGEQKNYLYMKGW